MGVDNKGFATCSICGAQYSVFTIMNRDMRGFAIGWKRRHEKACANRTPEQRLKWAEKYSILGRDEFDSTSIFVDTQHPAFLPDRNP